MFRFLIFFVTLFVVQLGAGLALELLSIGVNADFALVIAAPVAALVAAGPRRLRSGYAQISARLRVRRYPFAAEIISGALVVALALAIVIRAPERLGPAAETVAIAVLEEVAFRALPFLVLAGAVTLTRSRLIAAIAISSVVFTVGHGVTDVFLVVDKLVFAVAASILFLRTARIWLAAAVHAATNLFAIGYYAIAPSPEPWVFAVVSISIAAAIVAVSGPARRELLTDGGS